MNEIRRSLLLRPCDGILTCIHAPADHILTRVGVTVGKGAAAAGHIRNPGVRHIYTHTHTHTHTHVILKSFVKSFTTLPTSSIILSAFYTCILLVIACDLI